jgi:hypothetical protein
MMHQMNRPATARKFEDPDGFRRTPVSAPLPRRGTAASNLHSLSTCTESSWTYDTKVEVESEVDDAIDKGKFAASRRKHSDRGYRFVTPADSTPPA